MVNKCKQEERAKSGKHLSSSPEFLLFSLLKDSPHPRFWYILLVGSAAGTDWQHARYVPFIFLLTLEVSVRFST